MYELTIGITATVSYILYKAWKLKWISIPCSKTPNEPIDNYESSESSGSSKTERLETRNSESLERYSIEPSIRRGITDDYRMPSPYPKRPVTRSRTVKQK